MTAAGQRRAASNVRPGKTCGVGPDCDSGNCMGGLCQAASCTDGIQNGTETGQDCGGGGCPACADGKRCLRGSDCVSGVCPAATSTCAVPTCADLVKNGTETDADCGGSCAPAKRCADGKADARRGAIAWMVFAALAKPAWPPRAPIWSRTEPKTDIDCGGSCAPTKRCADGKGCGILGANCVNSVCTTGVCQMSSCGDMTKNGTETDVDCGGLSCGKCADTKMCLVAADCLSGVCPAATHLCAVPSCMDAVKNGTETDLNCGGTMCPKCVDGRACVAGTDCASGVCTAANVCAVPTCGDLVKNGTETAVDCGGSCAPTKRCANNLACLVAGDCTSGVCPAATHLCAAPTCSDTVLNGSETDVDCGGSCAPAQRCANNLMCLVPGDCVSASCVTLRCSAAGCQNCWKVQYRNRGPSIVNDTTLSLNIVSIGTTSVPLSQLKMRYWFTAENGTPVVPQDCDFADATAGSCSNVTKQMVSIPARPNANTYWEVGFNSGTLAAGGHAGEIQLRFHVGNFIVQDHTNDYSLSNTQTTLLDWNKVTLYNNGVLVWGIEP